MASPLTLLGQTIQQASGDYANRRLSLEDEARRRAERLADVQSARGYEQERTLQARDFQLGDENRHRGNALTDEQKKLALQNRYTALKEAEARGLIVAADFENQAVADAALVTLGQQLLKETKFQQEQPGNAATALAGLSQQEQAVRQKMDALEARLSSRPQIDQRAVQARALELATQNAKGKTPSREQIAMAMADATKEATDAATMQWMQDKQDASVQYQILSSQLNTLRQQQSTLTGTFHVAPSPLSMAAPAASPAPAAPAQSTNPMAGFVAQLAGAAQPPPTAPTNNLAMAAQQARTPEEIAAVKQSRTRAIAEGYRGIDEELAGPRQDLASTEQTINRNKQLVLQGVDPFQGPSFTLNGDFSTPPVPLGPDQQGDLMTRLLIQQGNLSTERAKRALAEQDAAKRRALLLQTPQFTTPGSILSVR